MGIFFHSPCARARCPRIIHHPHNRLIPRVRGRGPGSFPCDGLMHSFPAPARASRFRAVSPFAMCAGRRDRSEQNRFSPWRHPRLAKRRPFPHEAHQTSTNPITAMQSTYTKNTIISLSQMIAFSRDTLLVRAAVWRGECIVFLSFSGTSRSTRRMERRASGATPRRFRRKRRPRFAALARGREVWYTG